ncbi:MAG TPA: putative glycoside hydrolase [Acidimicrobiales bacterium]|nr:putative glycoside hydrolase [Acidimicrobiales bacterium]
MRWARRLTAVGLAVLSAAAGVAARSAVADGAVDTATGWGTFAHIATPDLGTAAARQSVASAYDVLALRGGLTSALLSDLHQRHAGITLLAYEKAAGLSAADVRTLTASHPEWIAKDRQGKAIHPTNIPDTTLADLTNPAFRAWQAQQMAAEVAMGADGAFIDTLGAYFPSEFYSAKPFVNGAAVTDAAWRDGSVDLLRRVKTATNKLVIANGFGLGSGNAYARAPASSDQLIAAADGVQIEAFTRTGDAPAAQVRKGPQWEQDMAFLESLGARGKIALAYTKINRGGSGAELSALRDYGLGTFLAAFAPGRSYFGFDDGRRIPTVASDAAWATGLGRPDAARVRVAPNAFSRSFSSGTLTIKLGAAPVVS